MPRGCYERTPEHLENLRKQAVHMRSSIEHGEACNCASCRAMRGEYVGTGNPRYGTELSEETKKKISESEKGKKAVVTPEHAAKISKSLKGKYTGEKNWGWKGGRYLSARRNPILHAVRTSTKYKHWRKEIIDEAYPDGVPKGVTLQVHHIKMLSKVLIDNKIETIEEAMKSEAVWDKKNTMILTKGDHYIISLLQRRTKNISKGFIRCLKKWIEENEHKAVEVKRI